MAGGENVVRTFLRTVVRDLTTGDTEDHGGRATGGSLLSHGLDTGRNIVRNTVLDTVRNTYVFFACLVLLGALVACSKPPQPETAETPQPTGLESIPAPDPSKYPNFSDMTAWKNPYLVVREDGIGFVDLSNREIHVLKQEEIPAELVALPSSAWPYGRVVLVAQAAPKNPSEQTKADLRKNRALLLGTLKELDVEVREAP